MQDTSTVGTETTNRVEPVKEIWTARHDGEIGGFDYAKAIAIDSTGNVYVAGDSAATGLGTPMGLDIVSIKYNSVGEPVWLNRYTSTKSVTDAQGIKMEGNEEDHATGIAVDLSGNVYVAGRSATGSWVLIKYDSYGHKIWSNTYNKGSGCSEGATKLALDFSGNVYLSGTRSGDFATLKYDPNGEILWTALYNGWAGQLDICYDMALDDDNNVYMVGESAGTDTNRDYATVKYDGNGDQAWVARYDNDFSSDIARVVAVDQGGNVYVAGTTGANSGWATIKYDSTGAQHWVATYDNQGMTAITTGLVVDAYGNAYVTGWVGGGGTNADILTIKYDTNGEMVWEKVLDESGDDYAYAMAIDKSGNIYVTGTSSQQQLPGREGNCYLTVKYDAAGNQQWLAYSFTDPETMSSSCALVVDTNNNVYVTGTDFGTISHADYAIAKYGQSDK